MSKAAGIQYYTQNDGAYSRNIKAKERERRRACYYIYLSGIVQVSNLRLRHARTEWTSIGSSARFVVILCFIWFSDSIIESWHQKDSRLHPTQSALHVYNIIACEVDSLHFFQLPEMRGFQIVCVYFVWRLWREEKSNSKNESEYCISRGRLPFKIEMKRMRNRDEWILICGFLFCCRIEADYTHIIRNKFILFCTTRVNN